jgi:putative FmdB family regulatory protein
MPIYEYTCGGCHATFDQLQRTMSAAADEPRPPCPTCGSTQTSRSLSVFAVAADTGGKSSDAPAGGMCGCGRVPGSCGMG